MIDIFVDTSVFYAENFFQTDRIKTLFSLAKEGKVHLVITKITYEEIKKHLLERVDTMYTTYKKLTKDRGMQILKDIDPKYLMEKIDKDEIKDLFVERLDEMLAENNCVLIQYTEIDIKDVFEKYFNNDYPFGKGDKKSEFPDAFSLKMIEKWCHLSKKKCIVLSADGDLINYKSEYLDIVPDYKLFLEDAVIKVEQLSKTKSEIRNRLHSLIHETHKEFIITMLKEWFSKHVHPIWHAKYIEGVDTFTPDIEIKEFYITSITPNECRLELMTDINYKLRIQDDYGTLDHNLYRFSNGCLITPLSIKITQKDELKIEEINSGDDIQIFVE